MLSPVDRLSRVYGRFLSALSLLGCAILMAMMLVIVTDVFLRNVVLPGTPRGLAWISSPSPTTMPSRTSKALASFSPILTICY